MSRQTRTSGQAASATATRQNEYFVPRDGIDREVISADICRYLGNDALVRPGQYENPQTGQVVHGYYITGYRNLTTAMIEDLKANSARWESERRAQTTRNTSGAHYRQSETHQSRQHHGPTEGHFQSDPYARDTPYEARYPGTGAPGFTGASGSYPSQQQQQQQAPPAQSYGSSNIGTYGGGFQQTQQSPPPERFNAAQAGSMMRSGYPATQEPPYIGTGANLPHSGFTSQNDPYSARSSTSSAAPQQPVYATSAPQQSGYPGTPSSFQQYPNQAPVASAQPYPTMQPSHEAYYRRGLSDEAPYARLPRPPYRTQILASSAAASPAQAPQPGYTAQGQQYDKLPNARPSTTPAIIQASPAGISDRRSDRDSDRHHRGPRR